MNISKVQARDGLMKWYTPRDSHRSETHGLLDDYVSSTNRWRTPLPRSYECMSPLKFDWSPCSANVEDAPSQPFSEENAAGHQGEQ